MDDVVSRFGARIAEAQPEVLFSELHQLCDETVGVKLFTCSRFDLTAGQAERIYTSDEQAYPLTGLKEIVPNRWTATVLENKKIFCAETIDELRDVFPDHEKIEALGLGAAINLPVYVGGQLLGTANLLDTNHSYTRNTIDRLGALSICAMLSFLAFSHMRASDGHQSPKYRRF